MHLVNGSQIIIVGGGPAGSFAALHLQRLAAVARLTLDIIILEPRDFTRPGPAGCNRCAGILSATLLSNLARLGLQLPEDVVQAELDSYVLHLGAASAAPITIQRPNPARRVVAVYRGSGPRLGTRPLPRSFDGWLMEQARIGGARIQRSVVKDIQPGARPVVVTAQERFSPDLVLVATGVNAAVPLGAGWAYVPPATETMLQGEALRPAVMPRSAVQVLFDYAPDALFGSLIPKGRYVSFSLLGHRLPPGVIEDLLQSPSVAAWFPPATPSLCLCAPNVAVGPARGYYADRMAVIGDATVSRLYKDGIGTAFLTAEAAAHTAVERGVAAADFAIGYRPVCRRIARDNLYGHLLFRLWAGTRRWPFLLNGWRLAVEAESTRPPEMHLFTRVLWGMFTGDETYRDIFRLTLSGPALWRLGGSALTEWRKR